MSIMHSLHLYHTHKTKDILLIYRKEYISDFYRFHHIESIMQKNLRYIIHTFGFIKLIVNKIPLKNIILA